MSLNIVLTAALFLGQLYTYTCEQARAYTHTYAQFYKANGAMQFQRSLATMISFSRRLVIKFIFAGISRNEDQNRR